LIIIEHEVSISREEVMKFCISENVRIEAYPAQRDSEQWDLAFESGYL